MRGRVPLSDCSPDTTPAARQLAPPPPPPPMRARGHLREQARSPAHSPVGPPMPGPCAGPPPLGPQRRQFSTVFPPPELSFSGPFPPLAAGPNGGEKPGSHAGESRHLASPDDAVRCSCCGRERQGGRIAAVLPTTDSPVTTRCWASRGAEASIGLTHRQVKMYSHEDNKVRICPEIGLVESWSAE